MAPANPTTNPFETVLDDSRDDWEDWEDDEDEEKRETVHNTTKPEGLLVDLSDYPTELLSRPTAAHSAPRVPQSRHSVQKPIRVKSKGRQKAQNAKAGIKVVTDMSQFRPQPRPGQQLAYDENKGKFVDAAALLALEGNPNEASIGSFSWLKRKPGHARNKKSEKKAAQDRRSDLSPDSRPIVIGLSVPSDDAGDHQVSPQTAVVETPVGMRSFARTRDASSGHGQAVQQPSVWSPDTEASESPFRRPRPASSVYSQAGTLHFGLGGASDVPPVPSLPTTLKAKPINKAEALNEDDAGTPCTLFEEDNSPILTRKQAAPTTNFSPESATGRGHGWWDHVTTPFTTHSNNPFKQQPQDTGSSSTKASKDWWAGAGEKKAPPPSTISVFTASINSNMPQAASSNDAQPALQGYWAGSDEKKSSSARAPGLSIFPPAALGQQHTASSTASSANAGSLAHPETHSEKGRILLEENRSPEEQPPPYEAPKTVDQVKYAAVLPPTHANAQPIPSPGPITPGFSRNMNPQGAIGLADIPLTPGIAPAVPLPDRVAGTYVTGDHFYEARGKGNKSERQRRRHEKEDAIARKVGGLWRGRGCIPEDGCFGRSGREGRKQRRICLGVLAGVISMIILAVVLAVTLTQKSHTVSGHSTTPAEAEQGPTATPTPEPSFWLNLTGFPPMPTGVLTVAGADNSVAVSGCLDNKTAPTTAWSCAMPKQEPGDKLIYAPNQPIFIFQIQYDNSSQELWKLSGADGDSQNQRRDFLTDTGFKPDPQPPSIAEMEFLGNTTDHIVEDPKQGEPTPFFISLLEDVDGTVGPNMVTRRQNNAISGSGGDGTGSFNLSSILPAPKLNPDGTGAGAVSWPQPTQQPVRLFDRGRPTEHYGFYVHFDKSIYLKNGTAADAADADGGVPIQNATSIVTFAQSRFLVQVWTGMGASTRLLGRTGGPVPDAEEANNNGTSANMLAQPGTMPWPVTVTVDQHGGDASAKIDYAYGVVTPDLTIDRGDARLIDVDTGFGGTLVNGLHDSPDMSLGGIDGGTGGCRCEWVNFKSS
ncbi:hypothetical protein GGR56DRAFT_619923 [Xylariaceae sp. FL0804]|nr:hypothetical protein GGR56DRAFT_619923 [Xylariaceae sp. FL0804]